MMNPTARRARIRWEQRDGVDFLKRIGLSKGDAVVDFGCGSGAYSVPAANVVGDDGVIVAVDARDLTRKRLERRAAARNIKRLRVVRDMAGVAETLGDRRCQLVLMYDVLHFMDRNDRMSLYEQIGRFMADKGVLSVHPKHVMGDRPARFFSNKTVDDIVREIEEAGFLLKRREETDLWHDHGVVRGTILVFGKCKHAAQLR
jgi:cyclopropane fatty-acyl-phospholipid synthase-like methyltransferase